MLKETIIMRRREYLIRTSY